jgi:DNA-binding FadR family transcriptional regulator
MDRIKPASQIKAVAAELRAVILAAPPGELIGGEELVRSRLGVSRSTVRQVARLLEREGLLEVRPGKNGGYFGVRPGLAAIESAVTGYLRTLSVRPEDATMIVSTLWVEIVRSAATAHSGAACEMMAKIRQQLMLLRPEASFDDALAIETDMRQIILALAANPYVELIFRINSALAFGNFRPGSELDGTDEHVAFLEAWKNAKLMELTAIENGDGDLAALAARHARKVWGRRVSQMQIDPEQRETAQ